jgi:hypothetical protein
VKFVATKKGLTKKICSSLSLVAVFGSESRDPGWVKIRIRDPGQTSRIRNTGSSLLSLLHLRDKSTELYLIFARLKFGIKAVFLYVGISSSFSMWILYIPYIWIQQCLSVFVGLMLKKYQHSQCEVNEIM